MIKIRRGLDLPIAGAPAQSIVDGPQIRSVAILGFDYHGMKPTMKVAVGDRVKSGQILFSDKKTEGVHFTAPAAGTIAAINRGEKRVLHSVVIDVDGNDAVEFKRFSASELSSLSREQVIENLSYSGLWTALRTRPFSVIPSPATVPEAIFVAAMDTNPLAADPAVIIGEPGKAEAFQNGLQVLRCLSNGKVFLSHKAGVSIASVEGVTTTAFDGVHPAGNVGTHIHFLHPVSAHKVVWTIGYQDVIAVGELFTTGRLNSSRVVSLAGPQVEEPRLVRTVVGANLEELTAGQLKAGENRLISGSVFGGRHARGAWSYLGRYHVQVSVLQEGRERPFLHYMGLGSKRFSLLPIYISKLFASRKFSFTTSTNGSERAMVPLGAYEKVMPLDILATQLLRSLIVGDTDTAQKLGCLELDEEDLALCTFVCPGKYEYGPILRDTLALIEKEG